MREQCAEFLACPVCGRRMRGGNGRLLCPARHSFDFARAGYVNLTSGPASRRVGDSAEMVEARARFLGEGHMRPLAEALAATSRGDALPRVIVELGTGTGYYLGSVARELAAAGAAAICAAGFDLSKRAVARAARDHRDCLFAVADVEARVPVATGSADLVLSAFAPRPGDEIKRIARDGAGLVVAAATERHLRGLRRRFDLLSIPSGKVEALACRLAPDFTLVSNRTLEFPLELSPAACRSAIMMGPNAWHRDRPPEVAENITDEASISIACFRKQHWSPACPESPMP